MTERHPQLALPAVRRRDLLRWGAVAGLALAWSAVRLFVEDPGPAYLLPIGLAGWWFGARAGAATGVLCATLFALTRTIEGSGDFVAPPTVSRLVIYTGAGAIAGEVMTALRRERRQSALRLQELQSIQELLTPPLPEAVPRVDAAISYRPAEQGVAGDFYVLAPVADGSALVAVGDVVGKGVRAAQLAWYVRTAIASAARFSDNPADILRLANGTIFERDLEGDPFVTLACIVLDADAGRVRWSLAGHPPPLLLDTGEALPLEGASGLPIGVDPAARYAARETWVPPGGGVLLYTDGITEAHARRSAVRDMFGEAQVREQVVAHAGASCDELVTGLTEAATAFAGGVLSDDLCLVAVRILPDV